MLWLRTGLVIENEALWEEVQQALEGTPVRVALNERNATDVRGIAARLESLALDVLFIDITGLGDRLEEALRTIKAAPNAPVIIVLNDQASPEAILSAMRAGASEYLYPPVADGLRKAIERLASERRTSTSRQRGRVFAFLSVKGGCGATTIACHVAAEIERSTGEDVLLADMDMESGMIAFLMKAKGAYSMLDAARNVHRLDASYWSALVSNSNGSKLDIIKAPPVGSVRETLPPEPFRMVLQFLRANYQHVVVDLGRSLSPLTLGVLDEVDEIFLISMFDLPALHQAKQVIHTLLDAGFGRNQLRLVLNQAPKRPDITSSEVQKALGLPVYETLPNDYAALFQAYTDGSLLPPTSELARQFGQLAYKITGVQPKERVKQKSALSLFQF
ncbi:MAG: AAA family ATPase [bacterium]